MAYKDGEIEKGSDFFKVTCQVVVSLRGGFGVLIFRLVFCNNNVKENNIYWYFDFFFWVGYCGGSLVNRMVSILRILRGGIVSLFLRWFEIL